MALGVEPSPTELLQKADCVLCTSVTASRLLRQVKWLHIASVGLLNFARGTARTNAKT